MKIEIDLKDVFLGDDEIDGGSVTEAIREAIIAAVTERVANAIERQASAQMKELVEKVAKERIGVFIEGILPSLLEHRFTETDYYGRTKPEMTVRDRLLTQIEVQAKYEPNQRGYDQNPFTKAINEVIESRFKVWKVDAEKTVDKELLSKAYLYAVESLRSKLGLSKEVTA